MSIDVSKLPNKEELTGNGNGLNGQNDQNEDPDKIYTIKVNRLQKKLLRQMNQNNLPIRVRVGFLSEQDKIQLQSDLCNKGYECSLLNNSLTIQ